MLTSSISSAQGIAIGAVGGVRATDDLTGGAASSVSPRYVVGPQLDIGLPFGLGFEVDALYRREAYQGVPQYAGFSEHFNSWEFPMLLKYRMPFPLVKPFVEAGYVPRVISGSLSLTPTSMPNSDATSQGFVIGGGVQFGIGRLRLSPEVRYTRWNNAPVAIFFGDGPESQSTRNQADILLGISWKLH
jgi:hypothetical protein